MSQPEEPEGTSPLTRFLMAHNNDTALIQTMIHNISSFFEINFMSDVKLTGMIQNGYSGYLRSTYKERVACLKHHIENNSFNSMVGKFFNNSKGIPHEDSELFTVSLDMTMYQGYIDNTIEYQGR